MTERKYVGHLLSLKNLLHPVAKVFPNPPDQLLGSHAECSGEVPFTDPKISKHLQKQVIQEIRFSWLGEVCEYCCTVVHIYHQLKKCNYLFMYNVYIDLVRQMIRMIHVIQSICVYTYNIYIYTYCCISISQDSQVIQ